MAGAKTPEELREKVQGLRAKLRQKAGAMGGLELRAFKKRIRRLQRRRRKLLRTGPKPAIARGEAKGE